MNNHETRISLLEFQVQTYANDMSEMKKEVRDIKKTIWMATGAIAAMLTVAKLIWH